MHIGAYLQRRRRAERSTAGAGVGIARRRSSLGAFEGHRTCVWCLMGTIVATAVLSIGIFEATRLSTHVLRAPCSIVGSEVIDIGTCTLCDSEDPSICEVHPIQTARLAVTFQPMHSDVNITGSVWYCKGRTAADPCQNRLRYLDQLSLDMRSLRFSPAQSPSGPIPCTAGEIFSYMQRHTTESQASQCYYSSRDTGGEDVWLSMPSPGLVDHAWFQKHLEYPVLMALGGMILLSVLLCCLALEGSELWASGIV